ncbi:hypothetical protein T459_15435 [Capsicum annuum]|uniref:Reverse transcriptase domain-containing protein n=1 Tax=Capsicum annuum TaxID=4072 RepID=A0A2G2ZK98_CAPAN|nr:hypothetical protein T459_15435 [Capsicum annuum]
MESRDLSKEEMMVRFTIVVELEDMAKTEEAKWRQKSKVLWLKQGDNNTKFFGRMATAHRRFNTIDRLVVRGEEIVETDEIKTTMAEFYKRVYSEPESWRPGFDMIDCPTISREEKNWLQRHFSEDVVLNVIKQCDGDKAPGPNGLTMSFFKVCWDTVKVDLLEIVHNFHQKELFEKSFNATFIVLIPKKAGDEEPKDFRPINLVGSVYKITFQANY